MSDAVSDLYRRLDRCMAADRGRFRRRIRGLKHARRSGKKPDHAVEAIRKDLDASIRLAETRAATVPSIRYPEELPIAQKRDDIADAIRNNQVVVVCGETGSGKTTQLPKICLDVGRGVAGFIGHTQPRRIAARSLAARIAEEIDAPLGTLVGYKIRFTDKTSPRSLVKVMTDGILLAETQGDRKLSRYDTIIIDEAHERSLNVDFLLGYLKQLLPRRPDLKVIVTSATIDPERFSEHFDGAPIIEVSGRTYPVETRYRPLVAEDPDDEDLDQVEGVLRAVDELAGEGPGDVLVFLPGEREIRETAEALRKHHPPETEILPLFARLSAKDQHRVFEHHQNRRIVLATNVAETSLTVPGIRYVVDTGVARVSRYAPRSGVQRLPIEAISQASAKQRAGRCGRVAEGVCIRLYEQQDYEQRPEFTDPEIKRTNLAAVILQMKALGLGEVDKFPFVEPPEHKAVRDGYETLHQLGAIDDEHELTETGRRLARLPVDPRIGRMILAGHDEHCLHDVLVIAAALSVQDPRERPFDQRDLADAAHEKFQHPDSDFLTDLNLWHFYQGRKRSLSGSQLRKACKQNHLSFMRLRDWEDTFKQLRAIVTEMGMQADPRRGEAPPDEAAIHRALLTGLLGFVGHLDEAYEYAGPRGLRFHIHPGSGLFNAKPKWIVAAEMVRTTRLFARCVGRVKPQWIEYAAGDLVKRTYSTPEWNPETAQVEARERVTLFGLMLFPARRVHYGPVNPSEAREIFIHRALVEGDYKADAPFLEHNGKVVAQVERLEDKARRRDILADKAARFAFYDKRLPKRVYSGHTLEQWRRKAERKDPRALFMTEDDLLAGDASDVTEERFPESITARAVELPLSYRLAPGESDDGVTVTVPLEALNQLDPQGAEWLVPGLLKDKVVALIKALPKTVRTNFVPAPDFADKVIPRLAPGKGSLTEQVRDALHAISGVPIPEGAMDHTAVPEHLKMRVRVVDSDGEEVAAGRDVRALQDQLADRARDALQAIPDHEYNAEGLTDWTIPDLPKSVEIDRAGTAVKGYPALTDENGKACLRLMDSPEAARQAHPRGLARLFRAHFDREMRAQARDLPGFDTMALRYAPIGDAKDLRESLLLRICERAFIGEDPKIRTASEWAARLDWGWNRLRESVDAVCALAGDVFGRLHALAVALDDRDKPEYARAVRNVRQQVAFLCPPGFIASVPWHALASYPRYLAAAQHRLERLPQQPQRDAELADQVEVFWNAYLAKREQDRAAGRTNPELETFRWMIEEYRVSLWAQRLGTTISVSPERLRKQWHKAGGQ